MADVNEQPQPEIAGRRQAEEALCQPRNGSELRAEERAAELQSANEALQAQIVERERAEETMREREEQYRSIFESTSDALLIFDLDGTIVEANPAACSMYGYLYEELIGLSGKNIVHPDYYHLFDDFKRQVKAGGQFSTQTVDIRKDGSLINVEVHGASFSYKGKPHLLAVVQDVTERVLARQVLEQRVEERTRELSTLLDVSYNVTLTLDLEHGFFFTRTAPQYVRTRGWLPLFFASEHVNLDNALEKELFEEEAARFPDQGTRFLALGTPVDTVASQAVSREAGIAALGLDRDRLQVAVIGSWHEARNIQKLLTDQVDTIGLYEDLFTALATGDRGRGIQLTVKLHPADARPDVLPGVQAGLARLAERCGLEPPLVLGDGLPEVLGACDVVVSLGFSSVQYDAFLLGKPSLILLPETVRRRVPDSWFTGGTVPMRYGVCTAVTSGAEVWRLVDEFQRPDRQRTFRDALAALTQRYDLRPRTVAEKCDRVLAWIAENLGNS